MCSFVNKMLYNSGGIFSVEFYLNKHSQKYDGFLLKHSMDQVRSCLLYSILGSPANESLGYGSFKVDETGHTEPTIELRCSAQTRINIPKRY